MTQYDETFTTLSDEEFAATATPLLEAYKESMGRRDFEGRTKQSEIEDTRTALYAHCSAWANVGNKKETVRRKAFCYDLIFNAAYE